MPKDNRYAVINQFGVRWSCLFTSPEAAWTRVAGVKHKGKPPRRAARLLWLQGWRVKKVPYRDKQQTVALVDGL